MRGWADPHAPWGQSINAASVKLRVRCVVGFETAVGGVGIPNDLGRAQGRVVAHARRVTRRLADLVPCRQIYGASPTARMSAARLGFCIVVGFTETDSRQRRCVGHRVGEAEISTICAGRRVAAE